MPTILKLLLSAAIVTLFSGAAIGQTTLVQGFHRAMENDPFATQADANDLSKESAMRKMQLVRVERRAARAA
jgi:hypothetical protein